MTVEEKLVCFLIVVFVPVGASQQCGGESVQGGLPRLELQTTDVDGDYVLEVHDVLIRPGVGVPGVVLVAVSV